MSSPEIPFQRNMFTGELVDTRPRSQRQRAGLEQLSLFSIHQTFTFGQRLRPYLANAPRPVLELISEDTRTPEEIEHDLLLEAQRNTVLLPGLSPLEPADILVETEKPSLPADSSTAVETNTSVKIMPPEVPLEAVFAIAIDEPADDEPEPEMLPPLPSPSKFAAYQTLIQVV